VRTLTTAIARIGRNMMSNRNPKVFLDVERMSRQAKIVNPMNNCFTHFLMYPGNKASIKRKNIRGMRYMVKYSNLTVHPQIIQGSSV
jgi:hypothetical protein